MGNVLSILAERGWGDADGDQDLDASSTKGAPRGVLLLGAQGQDSQDGSRSVPDRWVMGGKVTKVSTDQEETHYCILDLDHFWRLSAPAGGGASQGRGRDLALKEGDLVNYKLRRVHAEEQEEEGEDSGRWQVVEVERCTGGGGGGGQEDGGWNDDPVDALSGPCSWLSSCGRFEAAAAASAAAVEGGAVLDVPAVVVRFTASSVRLSAVGEEGAPEFECSWEQLALNYRPWKGDLLNLRMGRADGGDEGGGKVLASEPLRRWEGDGRVREWDAREGMGTLQEDVSFAGTSCPSSYRCPRPGDRVRFAAVECQPSSYNGENRWRSVWTTPRHFEASAGGGWQGFAAEQSEALKRLIGGGGGGVELESGGGGVEAGQMVLGESRRVEVPLRNTTDEAVLLREVRAGVARKGLDGSGKNGHGRRTGNVISLWKKEKMVHLPPSEVTPVSLECVAGALGKSDELVTFCFGDDGGGDGAKSELGIVVSLDVQPPQGRVGGGGNGRVLLRSSDQLRRGLQQMRMRSCYPAFADEEIRQGRRRNRAAASFCKFKLLEYNPPERMRESLDLHGGGRGFGGASAAMDDLCAEYPCLGEPLTPDNYSAKSSVLIHLDELEQCESIRRYDLFGVSFERRGPYLALEVPGLSEKRPSLVLGDSVLASRGGSMAYEGCIHEVHAGTVLMQFDSDFHLGYCGEVYDVTFRFNRGPFRRLHRAAELAMGLMGEAFLFPGSVSVGRPQVTIAEKTKIGRGGKPSALSRVTVTVSQASMSLGGWVCPILPPGQVERVKLEWEQPLDEEEDELEHQFRLDPPAYFPKRASGGGGSGGIKWFNPRLNREQKQAVKRILRGEARPTPYVIYGPPGTGKTVTVVEAILQLFVHLPSSRMLVCTPSNSSADLIAERLASADSPEVHRQLARLNAFTRREESVPEAIRKFSFQSGAAFGDESDVDCLRRVALRRVVVCTCSTAGALHRLVSDPRKGAAGFTHCLVDEAGHLTEAETLLPIMLLGTLSKEKGQQVVLAGDPMQLGPVIQSAVAKMCGAEESLLERLSRRAPYERDSAAFADHGGYDPMLVTKLVRNYRSHADIIKVPSDLFYHGELKVRCPRAIRNLFIRKGKSPVRFLPNPDCPVVFHGVRGSNHQEDDSPSWFNPVEVYQLTRYVQEFWERRDSRGCSGLTVDDVGIITPYRKQVQKIREVLESFELPPFKVGSVEEFQGQERPVIFVSTVRSSDLTWDSSFSGLCFVGCPKRTNVALTRAQSLLVVVADPHAVAAADGSWREFLRFCVERGCYCGCELPASYL